MPLGRHGFPDLVEVICLNLVWQEKKSVFWAKKKSY
jgi:hypothetical protein